MNRILTLGALALLGGAVSAQTISIAGETLTKLDSKVTLNNASDQDDVAANTKFTRAVASRAAVLGGHTTNHAVISMHNSRHMPGELHMASLMTQGSLFGMQASDKGSAVGSDGASGPMGVKFVFSAANATKGTLLIQLGGFATQAASVNVAVKGAGRTWTWKQGERPVMVEIKDYTLTGRVPFELTAFGGTRLSGISREHFSGKAAVIFKAAASSGSGVKVTEGPANCGGKLTGVASSSTMGRRVDCTLTGAIPSALGVVLLSPDGKTVTLPGGGARCDLFSNVIALLDVIKTDAQGGARHVIRLPANRPVHIWVQDAILDFGPRGINVKLSNWLEIVSR